MCSGLAGRPTPKKKKAEMRFCGERRRNGLSAFFEKWCRSRRDHCKIKTSTCGGGGTLQVEVSCRSAASSWQAALPPEKESGEAVSVANAAETASPLSLRSGVAAGETT